VIIYQYYQLLSASQLITTLITPPEAVSGGFENNLLTSTLRGPSGILVD